MKTVDQGVFLHRTSYSDSSLLAWFYTKQNGLQRFIFKGGKKKAHSLLPMTISEITYYGISNADLMNLTNVDAVSSAQHTFDPVKTTIAFFMAETLRKSAQFGDRDEKMFSFIEHKVAELNEGNDLAFFPIKFLIEYSDVLGFKPLFEDDSANVFNLDEGLFQHHKDAFARVHEGDGVALIQSVLLRENVVFSDKKSAREEALNIMIEYFKIHVAGFKELTSYEIVKEILRS